jgi:hypothetical protein
MLRGTAKGKLSPNVGFRRSSTGLVQQAMLMGGRLGNNAVLMYLNMKGYNQNNIQWGMLQRMKLQRTNATMNSE